MRYLPFFFLIFTAVGFAADNSTDEQNDQLAQKRDFKIAQELQIAEVYDQALNSWNDFLEKHPKSNLVLEAKFHRGLCFYNLDKFEDAHKDLDEVLNSNKKIAHKAEALLFCGLSALQLADKNPTMVQVAQKRLEAFLKEFPNSENADFAKLKLANAYLLMNDLDNAKKRYVEIWQKSPQSQFAPEAYLQTGYILLKQKSYAQCARLAMEFSQKWNQKTPEIYSAAVLAGDALYRSGDYEKAEKQYAFASDSSNKDIDKFDQRDYAMYNRGVCLVHLHNYDKAAQQFNEIITQFEKSPHVPAATFALGDAYWRIKNYQKAKEYLIKAAEIDNYSSQSNLILAEIYFKENDINNALKRIDLISESKFKCLPTEPESKQTAARQACLLRVNILSRSDDPKRLKACVELCNIIALQWPDSPVAPCAALLAAQSEFKLKNYENAISLCHKIKTQWKDSEQFLESQVLEALCHVQTQNYKDAGNLYNTLYKNYPNDNRRYEWLIWTCRMLDHFHNYEKVFSYLQNEIANIQPDELRPEALYLIGKAACELNKHEEALKYLITCQESYPNYPDLDKVLLFQGIVYAKQKNNEKALETFQKILDNHPNSPVKPDAVSYMIQVYRAIKNLDAALEQANKNIALNKDSQFRPSAILDSISILITQKKWDQALTFCNLFINDYPQHNNIIDVYQFRAMCNFNLKRFAECTEDSRKGLETAKQKEQLDQWELCFRLFEVTSLAQQDNKTDETQKAFETFMETKKRLNKSIANEDYAIFLYANALFNADKKDKAYEQYMYLYDNYKTSRYRFESAYSLGYKAAASKLYDKAKEYLFVAAKGSDPVAAIKASNKMARIFYDQKKYEIAQKWYLYAIHIYNSSKDATLSVADDVVLDSRVMVADCLYWQKKYAEALTKFNELPELPIQYQAMTAIHAAQCAIETEKFDLATSLIDKVLDANNAIVPELAQTSKKWEPAMQYLRAKIWFKTDKSDQAEKLFEQIVKQNANINPANFPETTLLAISESWFYLGELAFRKEEFRDAITKYFNVIYGYNIPELQAEACYEAGRCFESIKQTNQARKMYKKILDDYPNSPKVEIAKTKLQQLK